MVVFRIILKAPLKRVQNGGKIYVMFNRIKVHLVPHFGIILLYSLKLLACQVSCSNSRRFLLRSLKIYVTYSAQMTFYLFVN